LLKSSVLIEETGATIVANPNWTKRASELRFARVSAFDRDRARGEATRFVACDFSPFVIAR